MKAYVRNIVSLILLLCSVSSCHNQEASLPVTDVPDPDLNFVRGYRSDKDPCRLTGETEFTNQYLDDAADLVTCLTGYEGTEDFIESTGARVVAQTRSYTLFSVPRR